MQIIWTDFAIENIKDIFDYYSERAGKKNGLQNPKANLCIHKTAYKKS